MSRAHVIAAAIMVTAGAASAADAGEHAAPPNATFDVTIEHTVPGGKFESKRYRREWRDCTFLDDGERKVVYIDVPPGDDYYTRQYPGHTYRGAQFGLNLTNRRAWLRVYFGARAYVYSPGAGPYEPVYYQRAFDGGAGRYAMEGGLRSGSFTVTAEDAKIEEGFPWYYARIRKGARVTWRGCRRVSRRNFRIGLFD